MNYKFPKTYQFCNATWSWDRACTARQASKMSLNVTECQLSFYACSVFASVHSLTANQYLTQK